MSWFVLCITEGVYEQYSIVKKVRTDDALTEEMNMFQTIV